MESEPYPEDYRYEPPSQILRVGDGVFRPVADAVWNFTVSGLPIVESWLSYRRRSGAGKSTSALDEIRPEIWTAALTQELLELLWVLEATVASLPRMTEIFHRIIEGANFHQAELPQPTATERHAPGEVLPEDQQEQLML